MPAPEVAFYMQQVLAGLQYLHDNQLLHRDIKLGNILLTRAGEAKIADFGLCTRKEFPQEKKRTMCGTPNYLAPEIIKGCHDY